MMKTCPICGEDYLSRPKHNETCVGPFPAAWWAESDGDVLWWAWDGEAQEWVPEPPYVGTPLDLGLPVVILVGARRTTLNVGGWPGYHTHWTRLSQPRRPEGEP